MNIKSQLQQREFLSLKDERRVILKWATGCGKSKMTIDLINHAVSQFSKTAEVLFVVAERAHIQNWKDEFSKWNLDVNKMKVDIICYASLHKIKYNMYDIIVLDEAHHAFTEARMSILSTIYAGYVYLLSATLSFSKTLAAEELFGKFKTSIVTLKDAINNDILPDPKVYVVGMELDNTQYNQEIKIGNSSNMPVIRWEKRAKYIYGKIPCIIQCTQLQKYQYLTSTMEYWKQRYELSHNDFQRTKWVNTGSVRKRFLGELKTQAVRDTIESFPDDRRYVCFCSSVAQATELSDESTISSKRTSKYNQGIIDAFNKKKINHIYAVGMITEGMNLTDIQTGIIVQLDGKERLFIQKFGRSLRAEDPVSYIFYYKNTQDEVYLKNALENIDNKYVRHMSINQLNTIKL